MGKKYGIKKVIGIEPSEKSINSAIKKYMSMKSIKVIYINAVGDKLFQDGSAGLTDQSKQMLVNIFKNNVNADVIHLFWTIHYCMNTKQDFNNLFRNIDGNLRIGGKVIILYMNGALIHKIFKKYNGNYKNIVDGNLIFELKSYYDYTKSILQPYGNTIGIKMAGAYGLDNEIKENLVIPKILQILYKA